MSTAYLAGNIKIPQKQGAVSRSSARCLDASTRSQYHAMSIPAHLSTSAVQLAALCSPAAMLARTNVASVGRARARISRRKTMANAVNHVDVTILIAGMHALLHVTAKNHARFATRGATSSAAMRDAQKGAANHALPALKRSVPLAAHTPSATCRVLLHATGSHVRNDARDCCNAVINARPFVAQTARARCTVRSAHRTRSKLFELILSC